MQFIHQTKHIIHILSILPLTEQCLQIISSLYVLHSNCVSMSHVSEEPFTLDLVLPFHPSFIQFGLSVATNNIQCNWDHSKRNCCYTMIRAEYDTIKPRQNSFLITAKDQRESFHIHLLSKRCLSLHGTPFHN